MIRIIDGKGTGKTRRLIEIAKEKNATVVCENAFAMKQKSYAYGIIDVKMISYEEFLEDFYKGYINEKEIFLIDELEVFAKKYFLRQFGDQVIGYTLSNEE